MTATALLPPGSFVITADACSGQTLAIKGKPNSTCKISVDFQPSGVDSASETLTLPYDAANPATAALTGTGIAPTAKIAPLTVTFAKTTAGLTSATKTITITNTSVGASVTLSTLLAPIGPDFAISSDLCGGVVLAPKGKPGAKCQVKAQFTPPSGTAPGTVLTAPLSYDFSVNGVPPTTLTATLKGTSK
jgi:hypothetical protein